MQITEKLAKSLDDKLTRDLGRDGRLGLPMRYLDGDHDLPYMPRKARREYIELAKASVSNWLPIIPAEFAEALAVEGYRGARANDNLDAWRYWQDNGLDGRQTIVHRGALEYGVSFVLVLPGADKARPVIKPLSPLRSAAWYSDPDDDFPEVAILRTGTFTDEDDKLRQTVEVYDRTLRVTFSRPFEGGDMREESVESHGLGVTPVVRFRDRLYGESMGLVRPFKLHQDRINSVAFETRIALQYASFRQKWATGLAIPEDENGEPLEPFNAAVDRLWISEDGDTKFGDFAQTDIRGHQDEYRAAVATLASAAQISPAILTGGLVNVSAESLRTIMAGTARKLDHYRLLFGESWELVFRLAAKAAGDTIPDASAEVRWRDADGSQYAAKVHALAELATALKVPVSALWEEVPGITDEKLQRWRDATEADPIAVLAESLAATGSTSQAAPVQALPQAA